MNVLKNSGFKLISSRIVRQIYFEFFLPKIQLPNNSHRNPGGVRMANMRAKQKRKSDSIETVLREKKTPTKLTVHGHLCYSLPVSSIVFNTKCMAINATLSNNKVFAYNLIRCESIALVKTGDSSKFMTSTMLAQLVSFQRDAFILFSA